MVKKIPVKYVESTYEIKVVHGGLAMPPGYTRWPLSEMDVGDTFDFPIDKRSSVAAIASRLKRDHDKVFVIRKVDATTYRIKRSK